MALRMLLSRSSALHTLAEPRNKHFKLFQGLTSCNPALPAYKLQEVSLTKRATFEELIKSNNNAATVRYADLQNQSNHLNPGLTKKDHVRPPLNIAVWHAAKEIPNTRASTSNKPASPMPQEVSALKKVYVDKSEVALAKQHVAKTSKLPNNVKTGLGTKNPVQPPLNIAGWQTAQKMPRSLNEMHITRASRSTKPASPMPQQLSALKEVCIDKTNVASAKPAVLKTSKLSRKLPTMAMNQKPNKLSDLKKLLEPKKLSELKAMMGGAQGKY